jgi:hypothetical protein
MVVVDRGVCAVDRQLGEVWAAEPGDLGVEEGEQADLNRGSLLIPMPGTRWPVWKATDERKTCCTPNSAIVRSVDQHRTSVRRRVQARPLVAW